jgi:hypothetical protein
MRNARAFVCLVVLISAAPGAAQTVTWTHAVNVTATATTLQKTGGCDGCADAGAVSQQQILSGDGYVEFTVGETNTFFVAGLSSGDTDTGIADIDVAFRFNGAGAADVLENGVYQSGGDTVYASGDVFRIAIVTGKVQFIRNGFVLLEKQKPLQYPLLLDTSLGTIGATIQNARVVSLGSTSTSGGFVEKAGSRSYRPRLTAAQITSFLPSKGARGKFTFPAPYRTTGVRLTNASDCAQAQDCVWYVGYSYWRNTNNHLNSSSMYIFLGLDRNRGGAGPTLFAYNKVADTVQRVGALFPATSIYSWQTAEGWYFSATRSTALYTFLVGGGQLRRFDVVRRVFDPVPALDIDGCPRPTVCPEDASTIIQPHSSDDDLVHSVTVQDALWRRIGCLVYAAAPRRFQYFPAAPDHVFDECHVDKSGQWLVILESTSAGAVNNRIVNLQTGAERRLEDTQGALGHLDLGHGYAVGADNYNPDPNATIAIDLADTATTRPLGPTVHFNKRWDIVAANHIAHGNAVKGFAPETQYACGSNASRVPDMADEIVCFGLDANRYADGSLDVLVVAPVMTNLDAPGGGAGDYEKTPKGNIDLSGRYFVWTTNMSGGRLDAFVVKIPTALLR